MFKDIRYKEITFTYDEDVRYPFVETTDYSATLWTFNRDIQM